MNFYDSLFSPKEGEIFEKLYENSNILIEKIISSDKQEGKLYNQNYDEWVILMEGSALLEMAGEEVFLKKGDFVLIEKNTPHTVLKTKKGTLWLCVHIGKKSK